MLGWFSQSLYLIFCVCVCVTESLIELGGCHLSYTGQQAPEIFLSLVPSAEITDLHSHAWILHRYWGFEPQVFLAAQQAIFSHSSPASFVLQVVSHWPGLCQVVQQPHYLYFLGTRFQVHPMELASQPLSVFFLFTFLKVHAYTFVQISVSVSLL